jgi:hypothetical protein
MDFARLLLFLGPARLEVSASIGMSLTNRAWRVPALPYDALHPLADYDRAVYLYKVSPTRPETVLTF